LNNSSSSGSKKPSSSGFSFQYLPSFIDQHLFFMRALVLLIPLFLTQCVDQFGNPMSPFGPAMPPPYTDQREQYRQENRDYSQQQNQAAFERGISDARSDSSSGLSKSYTRHFQSYSPTTQSAYRAGYDQGYMPPLAPLPGAQPPSWQSPPSYSQPPSYQGGNSYTPPPASDPAYNQGYDFGLRDRVAGRQNDAGAHTGVYDPRFRRSFERGYSDAYSSRR
jgi:hypothetical protein